MELQFVELFMNEINSMLIYLFGVAVFYNHYISYTLLYRSASEDVLKLRLKVKQNELNFAIVFIHCTIRIMDISDE